MIECICKKDMAEHGMPIERVYIHLAWCPSGYMARAYDALPWYKKIFTIDPRKLGPTY